MKCQIKDLKIDDCYKNRIKTKPVTLAGRIKLWICNKKGYHDFEMVSEEWFDGNTVYNDWPAGTAIKDKYPVPLKEAQRWCSRHTVLRCKKCGFEWERLASGVKGCGAHTWIAGTKWPVEWQCLPWGDPNETVRVGTSSIPESVLQINDPELEHLRNIKV